MLRDLGGPEASSGPVCPSVPLEGHCPMGCSPCFQFLIEKHENVLFARLGCSGGISCSLCCGEHNTPRAPQQPGWPQTREQRHPNPIPIPPCSWPHSSLIPILVPDKPSPIFTPTPFLDLFHPHSHPIPSLAPSKRHPLSQPSPVPSPSLIPCPF